MKTRNKFLIALLVIALVHLCLAAFFFSRESEPKAPRPSSAKELGLEKEVKKIKAPVTQKKLSGIKSANAHFGEKLDYKSAVTGDIKDLLLSKKAGTGILVDLDTRKVLWAKNPRKSVPIASMTKMMTIMLALEELKRRPDINLDTPVKVSPAASKVGGSQVYLDPKETFPLRELLKTVAIKSANDSSYQVAEFLGNGDVNAFVKKMNSTAAQMGLNQTRFYNPHGLPGKNSREDNRSCPEDLVFIAETLLEYPTAMKWASTWTDSFRPKGQKGWQLLTNHNRLVNGSCPGVDGLKTGYIKRSGYCITVTCKRNGKRMVAVLTGFPPGHRRDRDKFAKQLLDWGYEKAYEDKQTVKKKNSGKQVL